MEETVGLFGYTLANLRPLIAQWDAVLADGDLSSCAPETGVFYQKALAELQEALLSAGYAPSIATPIAFQRCLDILSLGISLYFIESHTGNSYQDGYNPISGQFSRYRSALRDIASGGQLGELNQRAKHSTVSAHVVRKWQCR